MKVLHLRSSTGFYGAEALIEALVLGQIQAGDGPMVAALVDARQPHTELVDRLEARGAAVATVPSAGRLDPGVPGRLAALARSNGAQVLHTHDYKTSIYGLVASWMTGLPVVSTFHGEVSDTAMVRFYEALCRGSLRLFDGVALVSQAQRSSFLDPWRKKVPEFIPNGMDTVGLLARVDALRHNGARTLWRRRLGLGPEAILVATVGRLCHGKGQLLALDAMSEVMASDGRVCWALAGDGEDRQALEAELERRRLGQRVRLLGYVEDMDGLYAGVDVLLHPSLREGLPMVILEAMSAGLPVVASPVGEIPVVLADGAGVVLEDRGASLVEAVLSLLDATAREALGGAGQRRALERYGAARLASDYRRQLYEVVL